MWGSLVEVYKYSETENKTITIKKILPKLRSAEYAHRLILISNVAWTIFITGSVKRQWGFHCPKGWVHWKDFTDETGNQVGKGCD